MARSTSTTAPAPSSQAAPAQRRSNGPALNLVQLVGRICNEIEPRYTSSGLPVCTIRVATHDRQEPEFHDCVLWRKLAEFAGRYLAKGRLVYVQGRLHSRSWQAENGTTRRSVEVIAEDLQALDRPPAGGEEPAPQPEQG